MNFRSIYYGVCIVLFLFLNSLLSAEVFKARLAGTWYPKDPKELVSLLSSCEKKAQEQFAIPLDGSKIRALIVPHASLAYSGAIAMASYRLLDKSSFDRVILLAPNHTVTFSGVAVPSWSSYAIPSGVLTLDTDAINLLARQPLIQKSDEPFLQEHAIEVQLPFIYSVLPQAKIVPLIFGSLTLSDADLVAKAIKPLITAKTLVIATTDLIHYGARFKYTPFSDHARLRVRQRDAQMLAILQENDRAQLNTFLQETKATVCGRMPLNVLLGLINQNAFGQVFTRLVAYGSSQEVTPSDESFVTYGSLVISTEPSDCCWSAVEKRELLRYARAVLSQSFTKTLDEPLLKPLMTPLLQKHLGVFVTLYKKVNGKKELRGCIGRVISNNPLYQTVAEMVLAAARDPRFVPVTVQELDALIIEISVLTKPRAVTSYSDIVLNKHGIILTVGKSSALFLPKVPQEHGFTRKKTLEELSKKAGLAEDAWQTPEARFEVFEAIDFAEI